MTGYIYLVQCGDSNKHKIGLTRYSPTKRLIYMQVGCPYELRLIRAEKVPEVCEVEAMLHGAFSSKHYRGEWFELTEEDISKFDDVISYCKGIV